MPSTIATALAATFKDYPGSALVGGKLEVLAQERFTLASDIAGSYAIGPIIPAGAVPLLGIICSTVSLGSSTIAIGITGTLGKYRTAAVFTAVDTPTLFGNASVLGTALIAAEQLQLTVAVASLPASGTLHIALLGRRNG
jgi:hypothetical protein